MTFQNISHFSKVSDYLPILNGCLVADLIIIFLLYNNVINSVYLQKWYTTFQWSAITADILIIVIGIILTRFFYYYIFSEFSIWKFTGLAVVIQIIHDILFYLFFTNIKPGYNYMLDFFKGYAKEVSFRAILGDSLIMVLSCLFSSYFASLNLNINMLILIVGVYMVPYFINYQK